MSIGTRSSSVASCLVSVRWSRVLRARGRFGRDPGSDDRAPRGSGRGSLRFDGGGGLGSSGGVLGGGFVQGAAQRAVDSIGGQHAQESIPVDDRDPHVIVTNNYRERIHESCVGR